MPQTPREIVRRCLTFDYPERMPRDLWTLPWATRRYPEIIREIQERYPNDIVSAPWVYKTSMRAKGDAYSVGTYIDEWGCVFTNIQDGVIGEVKNPLVTDIQDLSTCRPPYEILPESENKARDTVNRFCESTDFFVTASCCPRPWERMQFLRGTANAMMDTALMSSGGGNLLKKINDFYLREIAFWVSTDVDAISFMDDWGSQTNLLISPQMWREIFKPIYREYCDLAHSNGKFVFMHSDGCISSIYDDLIEISIDALNSQLFSMDMSDLEKRAKGKIAFWGEIDRQHVLPSKDPQFVLDAVRKVAKHFYDPKGGIFNQFEFGVGCHGPNALLIYEEWDKIQDEER